MANQGSSSGFVDFKPSDLSDSTLWKLNNTFRSIFGKLGTLLTPGSTPTYPSNPTFTNLNLSAQTTVPTDPKTVLTRGSADLLYSPKNLRVALLTGAYPNATPASGQQNPVQPIPSTIGIFYTIGFSSTGAAAVANAVASPAIVTRAGQGICEQVFIAANVAPTGADLIVMPTVNGNNLLTSGLHLPAGSVGPANATNVILSVGQLQEFNLVNLNVTQIGSGVAGSQVTVEIRVRVL